MTLEGMAMRKPVKIDMKRAGCLAKWVKERALFLDTCHRVFWLGEPYTVDMERRLSSLPAE